jgi:hypothetical protein
MHEPSVSHEQGEMGGIPLTHEGRMLTRRLRGVKKPCANCYITGFRPNLTYANGATGNFDTGVMLHHAVLSSSAASDLTCPPRDQRFFASGNERTAISLPRKYGYRVRSGDRWNLLVDLMNMEDHAQTVYVDVTFRLRRGRTTPVTPAWLDIGGCRGSVYSIPAGFSDTHRQWRSPFDARVVAIGGHVHDFGRWIEATDETRGKRLCRSVAGYGTKPAYMGHLESMTTCRGRRVGTVRKGDLIRLHSVYDSPEPMDDVMGIMIGYLARRSSG